jgi:ribosomal protein L40E
MARVTCRCGEILKVGPSDPDRLSCTRCGARIRIRRNPEQRPEEDPSHDGFVRFSCQCGRRLKVSARERPEFGKCPTCARIVPVPESAWAGFASKPGQGVNKAGHPEARTEELDTLDLERLERWSRRFLDPSGAAGSGNTTGTTMSHPSLDQPQAPPSPQNSPPPAVNLEAGLRICPRCGKPVHLKATVCRACGAKVPSRL